MTFTNKRVLLVEAEHKFFCRRKLYVATSRCTDPALFHVASLDAANKLRKMMEETLADSISDAEVVTKMYAMKRPATTPTGNMKKRAKK